MLNLFISGLISFFYKFFFFRISIYLKYFFSRAFLFKEMDGPNGEDKPWTRGKIIHILRSLYMERFRHDIRAPDMTTWYGIDISKNNVKESV